MKNTRTSLPLKLLIGLAAVAALGYLFVRSLETTHAEPYLVERAHMRTWTLVLEPVEGHTSPLLSLRTSGELAASLFRQLFRRTMESMSGSVHSSVPIVLNGEFARALSARMTPDALLASARQAGLEAAVHEPRCLAHLRTSEPGSTRQAYIVLVTSPSIVGFREQLARTAPDGFEAAALAPIMFVGASDPEFHRWLPFRAGDADCVSPVQITD
jgi:hypothetical protein